MDATFEALAHRRQRRRGRRRAVAIAGVGVAFLAATTAWLATSGVLSTNIQPPTGATGGAIAAIDSSSLTGQVQSTGHKTVGVPVSRAIVAKDWVRNTSSVPTQTIRFSVAWTNPVQATLHGNDLVALGIAYPVAESSGACSSGYYVADTQVSTGGGVTGVCAVIDTAATGRNVDTAADGQQGMILLSKSAPGGTLTPGTTPPTTVTLCTTTPGAWCQPHGVGDQTGGGTTNRTLYFIAQVVNNGGNVPPGQQPSPGAYAFFVGAKPAG